MPEDTKSIAASEKLRLSLLAFFAEFVFAVAALVIAVAFGGFAALGLGGWWGLTTFLVIFALVLKWLQPDPPPERQVWAVDPKAPIWREVEALRVKMGVPKVHRIVLDQEPNASARADAMGGVFWPKRTLTLGVPLLLALTKDQALAVVAHELGHFSKQHGQLAHWVYRVRWKWGDYAVQSHTNEQATGIIGAMHAFARAFLPYFVEKSARWSRACEYEADRIAAQAVSAESLIGGIARLLAFDYYRWEALPKDSRRLALSGAPVSPTYWQDLIKATNQVSRADLLSRALDAEHRLVRRNHDRHPKLADRAAALGVSVADSDVSTGDAGPALIGVSWDAALQNCEASLASQHAAGWSMQAAQVREVDHLMQTSPDDLGGVFSENSPEARLIAQRWLTLQPEAFARLFDAASPPENVELRFAVGVAQLSLNPSQATDWLKSATKEDDRLGFKAASALYAYASRFQSGAAFEHARQRYEHYSRLHARAFYDACGLADAGDQHVDLSPSLKAVLAAMFRAHQAIDAAWIKAFRVKTVYAKEVTVGHLLIRSDPEALRIAGVVDESALRGLVHRRLDDVSPPAMIWIIETCFTTEAISPSRLARFRSSRASELKAPSAPFAKAIKIDSV
jgi:Zn-dependent protease with chaperone function